MASQEQEEQGEQGEQEADYSAGSRRGSSSGSRRRSSSSSSVQMSRRASSATQGDVSAAPRARAEELRVQAESSMESSCCMGLLLFRAA